MNVIAKVRHPKQGRSRQTFNRLLDSAEALMAEKEFDQITVADIVRQANSSIGSFYARFSDKHALLAALYDRHQEQMMEKTGNLTNPEKWRRHSLRSIVVSIVAEVVRMHRQNQRLLRALVIHGHQKPDPLYQDDRKRSKMSLAAVARLLLDHKKEIGHPHPDLAARLGFLFVLATAREKILFGESTSKELKITDGELVRELADAFLAYLRVDISSDDAGEVSKS